MQFQSIKTKRLAIREYSDEYLDQVFEYRSDPRIYESYTKKHETKEDLKEYLKKYITEFNQEDGYTVFIILKNDKVIGEVAISYWDHNNEKNAIGYAVSPEYQKNGYAYEAVTAIVKYMFETMNRNRIQAGTDYNNEASIALLKKLGFKEEGHFRQAEYKNGEWRDSYLFALLKEDWLKIKEVNKSI
ncbi:MAG: GNAT family N-acetyltransferase [Spirochaetales bacterium]|jgi:ribosomal-protein-alanine N-acetyltransferase